MPANYPPVSLTCIASKLMEHILCSHIRGHLETHQILSPCNHCFRSKHYCETQLVLTTHSILKERDSGKQIDVAILYFSKTFDTVPNKRLLGKIEFTGDVHRWISTFLTGRKQSVVDDGERSEEADVLSGVPLSTLLGPLFSYFISMTYLTWSTQAPVADFSQTTVYCTTSWTASTTSCNFNKT